MTLVHALYQNYYSLGPLDPSQSPLVALSHTHTHTHTHRERERERERERHTLFALLTSHGSTLKLIPIALSQWLLSSDGFTCIPGYLVALERPKSPCIHLAATQE